MKGKKWIIYFVIPFHTLALIIFAVSAFIWENRILTICAGSISVCLSLSVAVNSTIQGIKKFFDSR